MEINNEKMEELLQLIEELVVNKIRIEKIQEQTKDLEVKRYISLNILNIATKENSKESTIKLNVLSS